MRARDWAAAMVVAGFFVGLGAGGALAETGSTGGDGSGPGLPVWVAPVEKPGQAAPAGEVHARCGGLVAWTNAPAGSGTWAVRPLAGSGPGAHEVIGTWRREAGLGPAADLGSLPSGRYQLTLDGDAIGGRVLVVDCASTPAGAAILPATVLAPAPVAQPALPQDAEGNTIPAVSEETIRPAAFSAPLPASPLTVALLFGLLAGVALAVGSRRLV